MYFNDILTLLKAVRTTDDMGYITNSYSSMADTFPCDVQPYTKEAAMKEYGIEDPAVVYRCFLPAAAYLPVGTPVRLAKHPLADSPDGEQRAYTVIRYHRWENHVEVILIHNS